jgi:integrase
MILLTYRHGLRADELCDLRWDQVDFNGAVLRPQGQARHPEHHPIQGELRALRRLHREAATFALRLRQRARVTIDRFVRMIALAATYYLRCRRYWRAFCARRRPLSGPTLDRLRLTVLSDFCRN